MGARVVNVSGERNRGISASLRLTLCLLLAAVSTERGVALASVDPACDQTGPDGTPDGVVDDYVLVTNDPNTEENEQLDQEAQQYLNMLNFYSFSLAPAALRAPLPFDALKVSASFELNYIPSLNCVERTVFYGTKTEDTNKTPVLPRLRVSTTLPFGVTVGIQGVPPVTLFGVNSGMIGLDLGYGKRLGEKFDVGVRGFGFLARVAGEMAGPFSGLPEDEVDDVFRSRILGIEAQAGYRAMTGATAITPYLGIGYTNVKAWMFVGENYQDGFDENDWQNADAPEGGDYSGLYKGLNLELGAHATLGKIDAAFALYAVPLNMLPGNDRFFFSPRLRIGYNFL